MEGLGDTLVDEDKGEGDHGEGGDPGYDVEEKRVGVLAHEVFAIDEKQDEDDDDGEPDTVTNLREDENFPKRGIGKENDAATDDNQDAV